MHRIARQKSSNFDEILNTAADFELDERHVIKNKKGCIGQTPSSTERISCLVFYCHTIRHSTLLNKMALLDIPDAAYNWLVDFFVGHGHCTRYGGTHCA